MGELAKALGTVVGEFLSSVMAALLVDLRHSISLRMKQSRFKRGVVKDGEAQPIDILGKKYIKLHDYGKFVIFECLDCGEDQGTHNEQAISEKGESDTAAK